MKNAKLSSTNHTNRKNHTGFVPLMTFDNKTTRWANSTDPKPTRPPTAVTNHKVTY